MFSFMKVFQIYRNKYFYLCENLPNPAFYVCGDISVNSGPGNARAGMRSIGRYNGVSECTLFAHDLFPSERKGLRASPEQLAPQLLPRRCRASAAQEEIPCGVFSRFVIVFQLFTQGWLRRAEQRDAFINSC